MVFEKQDRIRVGVIGLGRLWEARHKPALLALTDRFRITAVYDQVLRRAEIEARQLGCVAALGLRSLVERPDVDVVYLVTPQWYGFHPIDLACDVGKPVYCALQLAGDLAELERLASRVEAAGIPFMAEFARRFYPATTRLRELLATKLGPPRLVLGHSRLFFDRYGSPGPSTQTSQSPLMIDPGSYLLDWCSFLFDAHPRTLQGNKGLVIPDPAEKAPGAGTGPDFESFIVEFEGGGTAQISFSRYHRAVWGEATRFLPTPGYQVYTERGAAWVELPDRILWSDGSGNHEERLSLEPSLGHLLNEQFHCLLCGDPSSTAPSIHDALRVARHTSEVRRSQREGRMIVMADQTESTDVGRARSD